MGHPLGSHQLQGTTLPRWTRGGYFFLSPAMAYRVIAHIRGIFLSRRWTFGIGATVGWLWTSNHGTGGPRCRSVGIMYEMYMEDYIMARGSGFLSHSHISPSSTQRLALLLYVLPDTRRIKRINKDMKLILYSPGIWVIHKISTHAAHIGTHHVEVGLPFCCCSHSTLWS